MSTIALSRVATPMAIPPVRSRSRNRKESIMICLPRRFKPLRMHVEHFCTKSFTNVAVRNRSSLSICAAALSATCSNSQSQTATVEKPTSTITVAPPRPIEKTPIIDPGGTGFPPTTGGGGGGGGGGEGPFRGGFFLFLFLAFLDFLKEKMEKKSEYQD